MKKSRFHLEPLPLGRTAYKIVIALSVLISVAGICLLVWRVNGGDNSAMIAVYLILMGAFLAWLNVRQLKQRHQ